MTAPTPPGPGGIAGSLRRLASTGLSILQLRLQLLLTEVEQEKLRLFDALLRVVAGLLVLGVGLVLLVALVLLLVQPEFRLLALAALTALFLAGGAALLASGRKRWHQPGALLEGTVAELERDREALRG